MKRVAWHAEAREEFASATLWYDEAAGDGRRFIEAVGRAIEALRLSPQACAPAPEVDDDRVRRARVSDFPFHAKGVEAQVPPRE